MASIGAQDARQLPDGWTRIGADTKEKELGERAVVEQAKAERWELAASRIQAAVREWREVRRGQEELRDLAAARLQTAVRVWLGARPKRKQLTQQSKNKKQRKAQKDDDALLDEAMVKANVEKLYI